MKASDADPVQSLRGRYRMWTTGQQKRFVELWQQPELSIEEIGFRLDRSRASIQTRARELRLPDRKILRRKWREANAAHAGH